MTEPTKRIPLVAVVGPTASGKTGLAVELAKAFDGEVISADSMQVYRQMDIATAKPTAEEMSGIPHHLIDFLEPDDAAFSVADYAELAHTAISEIAGRKKLPILAGGTGLYVNAVVDNINYAEIRNDETVRLELESVARQKGNQFLLGQLAAVDPELAAALHPNNLGRIIRALEVYRLTGIPMSEHQRRSRMEGPRYDLCMLGLSFAERKNLYDRINRRVDIMMEEGLLEETRRISRIYGGTARQAIGYKELETCLNGSATLEACVAALKQATRRYAKRQMTWFGRDPRIHWLTVDSFYDHSMLLEAAKNIIHNSGIL